MTQLCGTVTVNAAFLQDIKEDSCELHRLQAALRALFHRPDWRHTRRREAVRLLEALRDQLAMHFALENFFGYFEEPASVAPRMADRAERLRGEHEALFERIAGIAERSLGLWDHAERRLAMRIACDFSDFDQQFETHEEREQALIVASLYDELGVGD